ncbi:TPA: hypothetical protein EYP66_25505 [Candidatus Poribacteria bacterium]|nr:hypothetical protein [Candidatus Poribacteria bacterium]
MVSFDPGENPRNLTKHSAKDASPSWSPNGRNPNSKFRKG